ncbi:MAG: hypothetical protein A2233_03600 [Candidatus Kerfeldbacteria bacterium RIFOXYA2_FULL_38_24]|uniref:S1 motif domain-containing protein n=1 Tax=Candidatus Kerfeldbacteria bacterium RIFOXYB2_FULL_38_14 TaxID=1798547 RepID=A0A1G2BED9_9BACT|nr:MAG: hypothetical protein A2233_03600 [Candidatus Kerfeldbacteria bacterium RIFOXYA2_FULL_38_24]OGY87514.1 MAG: hypothetical protein A2319_04095 [Candidatus Kerfeldbacteria bacterium RIFOXYB2_FULL_38_14]OGY90247.1 MAG: hypothetical protein A2458_03780 [Candidatus Kerfeldbacteria bacterium RIFOXYC2_FULL_38_9]
MAKQKKAVAKAKSDAMQKLLAEHEKEVVLPKVGDVIEGTVISAENNVVHIDIKGIATGVVRGPELVDESGIFSNLRPGDIVNATVLEIENELGVLELSFREAGHQKAWESLIKLMQDHEVISVTVVDANKGGLIVRYGNLAGFMPVSQLTIEHYPRVEGANRQKILSKLQTYVGVAFQTCIIDVDEPENKLIFSEKAAKENEQSEKLSGYNIGTIVEGVVTGVVDFGAFVEFGDGLEGLVHISELAWQRIDHPKDIVAVGDKIKAQIISIDHGKISLSIRRLEKDPWKEVAKKYKVGSVVEGTVLKLNPFGAFVELDRDIHGLAHISELSWKKISTPEDVLTIGKDYKFKIVSIEADDHRLGLSLKQMTEKPGEEKEKKEEKKEEEPTPATPVSTEEEKAEK